MNERMRRFLHGPGSWPVAPRPEPKISKRALIGLNVLQLFILAGLGYAVFGKWFRDWRTAEIKATLSDLVTRRAMISDFEAIYGPSLAKEVLPNGDIRCEFNIQYYVPDSEGYSESATFDKHGYCKEVFTTFMHIAVPIETDKLADDK